MLCSLPWGSRLIVFRDMSDQEVFACQSDAPGTCLVTSPYRDGARSCGLGKGLGISLSDCAQVVTCSSVCW